MTSGDAPSDFLNPANGGPVRLAWQTAREVTDVLLERLEIPRPASLVMLSGAGHASRATVLVFGFRHKQPALVLKLATTADERDLLTREARNLAGLRAAIQGELRASFPEVLDLRVVEVVAVLTMRALPGKRPLLPHPASRGGRLAERMLASYCRRTFAWSNRLAVSTTGRLQEGAELADLVDRFAVATDPAPPIASRYRSFSRALAQVAPQWASGWQHGDLTTGNVLFDRGAMRAVDWSHAQRDLEPWFDSAYAPCALASQAHRAGAFGSVREAMAATLTDRSWSGRAIESQLLRGWAHPIPLAWAVAVTSMRTALRGFPPAQPSWLQWREFSAALFTPDLRHELPWLVPEW